MEANILHAPVYTGLFAAALMLMQMVLMGLVIKQRGTSDVLIGDGGVDAMQQAVRAHGNFIENAPTFLIGLALIELMVGANTWVIVMGSVFVLGRLLHAVGMRMTTGLSMPRLIGTIASILVTLVAAGYLGYTVLGKI
tara:strand:+ start:595 stop:1008 length:414 start_codon:yes stop_codon:yes gene_type:complete